MRYDSLLGPTILGDDTVTGRRLMEMIQPEACMDKPEAVDCAAVKAEVSSRNNNVPLPKDKKTAAKHQERESQYTVIAFPKNITTLIINNHNKFLSKMIYKSL